MLATMRKMAEQARGSHQLIGLAPSALAAKTLESESGIETAVMDQIMRQRNSELKAAVPDQLEGNPDKALERLRSDVLEVHRSELAETTAKR